MNNIEFGKEIQKLSKLYKEKFGKDLNFSINLETEEISSSIYSGKDYPKNRKELISFLEDKILKSKKS